MYAIETASGRLRWKFSTTGFIVSTPAMSPDGSVVYVGSADDYLYAVETGNGTLKWKYLAGSFVLSVRLAVQV
jgi:outer membrane protein assembly factor BamB